MQIIFLPSNNPVINLAVEEYFFTQRNDDVMLLYINDKSVIVGSNKVVQNEVNIEYCRRNDIKILRRISGGGAVYHDNGNLNFSFITNRKEDTLALSDDFLKPVAEVLMQIGFPVRIGQRKDLWLPDEFKICGTASKVTKTRELHHGTLLFDANLVHLHNSLHVEGKDITKKGTASVRSKVKNLLQFQSENGKEMYREIFLERFYQRFETKYSTKMQIFEISKVIDLLPIAKYRDNAWNFRK